MPEAQWPLRLRTGEAKGAPVCVNLKTYPVKVEGGKVLLQLCRVTACATGRDPPGMVIVGAGEAGARAAVALREQRL